MKAEIQSAYKYLGKEDAFYDGMIITPPFETVASLCKRLSKFYESLEPDTVEFMVCFTRPMYFHVPFSPYLLANIPGYGMI